MRLPPVLAGAGVYVVSVLGTVRMLQFDVNRAGVPAYHGRREAIPACRTALQLRLLVARRENHPKLARTEQDARSGRPHLYLQSSPDSSRDR